MITTTTPPICLSAYTVELDLASKTGAKIFKDGAEKLPTKFSGEVTDFRLFINDVASRAKKCRQYDSILTFNVDGEKLNLITDYGRIPMKIIIDARETNEAVAPTISTGARPNIDSMMMFECLENSIDTKVR